MQVCEEPLVSVRDEVGFHARIRDTEDQTLSQIKRDAIEKSAWGIAASIDIYDCDPATIRNADKIRQFVIELCDLIEMKRFQDTLVVNFGEDERVAGFSMVQLIETSLISAHFANLTNATYLDVFSCKPYEPKTVEQFAMKFFGGSRCITYATLRL
jgi:S-adenosylmethionine/arginine decarboxylase-like enzyme